MVFAAVGFAAGLVGTAMSNGLLAARKKLDPEFRSQNQAPDVALNAATWAAHMGLSSNLRYQILNGVDMARPFEMFDVEGRAYLGSGRMSV